MEKFNRDDLIVKASVFQFKGSGTEDIECCSFFGCGKPLSETERLFGHNCINHQNLRRVDVAKLVQSKK